MSTRMLKPQKKLRSADRALALLCSHSELAHFPALFFQLQGSASHIEKDDKKRTKLSRKRRQPEVPISPISSSIRKRLPGKPRR